MAEVQKHVFALDVPAIQSFFRQGQSWMSGSSRAADAECATREVSGLPLPSSCPVIQQPALALRRMRAQAFLVGLGAPAWAVRITR